MTHEHDQLLRDEGFCDGVRFVAHHLRVAADRIAQPQYADFDKDGKKIRGISRVGHPHLARKYRELADELERLVTQ